MFSRLTHAANVVPSPTPCLPAPALQTREAFGVSGLDWVDIPPDVSPSVLLDKEEEDILSRLSNDAFNNWETSEEHDHEKSSISSDSERFLL